MQIKKENKNMKKIIIIKLSNMFTFLPSSLDIYKWQNYKQRPLSREEVQETQIEGERAFRVMEY